MKTKSMAVKSALVVCAAALLQGCSVFSVGKSDYSCPGGVDGVRCMSARDVYKATDGSDYVPPQSKDGQAVPAAKAVVAAKEPPVPLPTINQPMPIRTAAEIMRIWVAPWEDGDGDLHADGFVYTEVNQRRWNLGNRFSSPTPILKPLSGKPDPKP